MYAVFAFSSFYPRGGWMDTIGIYDDLPAAEDAVANRPDALENWHIVDMTQRRIVKSGKTS